jgi:hypothetical protein
MNFAFNAWFRFFCWQQPIKTKSPLGFDSMHTNIY